jgi:hypothetical protein
MDGVEWNGILEGFSRMHASRSLRWVCTARHGLSLHSADIGIKKIKVS